MCLRAQTITTTTTKIEILNVKTEKSIEAFVVVVQVLFLSNQVRHT